MHVIYHFLSFVFFSIGFMIFFCMPIKKKSTFIILLLFITGYGIGIHEHISYQDEWGYPYEDYEDLVLNIGSREGDNPWRQMICLAFFSSYDVCPDKDDPRWQEAWYFGEKMDWRKT